MAPAHLLQRKRIPGGQKLDTIQLWVLPACAPEVESDTAGIRFFFMAFIVLGSWAMLSLLTGVMSEHMIEKSAARKAEMKEEAAERRKVRA